MKILINVAIAVAGIFLAVGSVYAKSNGAAKNVALADRILSDTLMTRVDSMAREILAGRMPTASILMSRKNYLVFLFWRDIASRCKRSALSIVFIF